MKCDRGVLCEYDDGGGGLKMCVVMMVEEIETLKTLIGRIGIWRLRIGKRGEGERRRKVRIDTNNP